MVLIETIFGLVLCGVVIAFAAPPIYAAWKRYSYLFIEDEKDEEKR